jgi:hypothetical protein
MFVKFVSEHNFFVRAAGSLKITYKKLRVQNAELDGLDAPLGRAGMCETVIIRHFIRQPSCPLRLSNQDCTRRQ